MKQNKLSHYLYAILTAGLLVCQGTYAGIITKSPDVGDFWMPLSSTGTYIYANSFVAPDNGMVSNLGLWLRGGPADLYLQVFGSVGGNSVNGPDSATVIATTAQIAGQVFDQLSFISSPTASSLVLVAGQVYWFAASTVGLPGTGSYSVGGHTQNSAYADNGTFWYSNDPTGITFDGQGRAPEMAFQVVTRNGDPVPVPATLTLIGLALAGLGAMRVRRSARI